MKLAIAILSGFVIGFLSGCTVVRKKTVIEHHIYRVVEDTNGWTWLSHYTGTNLLYACGWTNNEAARAFLKTNIPTLLDFQHTFPASY